MYVSLSYASSLSPSHSTLTLLCCCFPSSPQCTYASSLSREHCTHMFCSVFLYICVTAMCFTCCLLSLSFYIDDASFCSTSLVDSTRYPSSYSSSLLPFFCHLKSMMRRCVVHVLLWLIQLKILIHAHSFHSHVLFIPTWPHMNERTRQCTPI
jgi:hypothetical protein